MTDSTADAPVTGARIDARAAAELLSAADSVSVVCHIFPDAHAHGRGEDPQPIYAVAFPAQALWGPSADPRDEVILDLWEPYLEPAHG